MFLFSPQYLMFMLPAILLVIYSQIKVKGTYAKYSQVRTRLGYSGAQVAREMLDRAGMSNIRVESSKGWLSDHYDPNKKVLRLSPEVYQGQSIASLGIAAHETGHAMQDKTGYLFLKVRTGLFPVTSLGSQLGPFLVIFGVIFQFAGLINLGILLFSFAVFFTLVTLPVEFNASRRAVKQLVDGGYVSQDEVSGVRKVLSAAALTYVAAAAQAIMTLLYYLSLRGRR